MDHTNNGAHTTQTTQIVEAHEPQIKTVYKYMGVFDAKREKHPYSVMTTGQVGKATHVAPRTVSQWCEKGLLKCYRIPGSNDRRIYLDDLITFCIKNNIRIHPSYLPTKIASYGIDKQESPPIADHIDNPIVLGQYLSTHSIRCAIIGNQDGLTYTKIAVHTVLALHLLSSVVLVLSEDINDIEINNLNIPKKELHRVKILKRPLQPGSIIEAIGIDPENRDISSAKS